MVRFRLWVLLGSIVLTLLCRGLKDLEWQPVANATPNGSSQTNQQLANELTPEPP